MNRILLFILLIFSLETNSESPYTNAEKEIRNIYAITHDVADSTIECKKYFKWIIFKDSLITLPKQNLSGLHAIHKKIIRIVLYKNNNIASIEKIENLPDEIHTENGNGIIFTAKLDSLNAYYFDEEKNPISEQQFKKIETKMCFK
jgi:hypothetical protein